ncbi:MAG: hypothetical protein QW578_07220, partial [Thermoplasmatales archaeon]
RNNEKYILASTSLFGCDEDDPVIQCDECGEAILRCYACGYEFERDDYVYCDHTAMHLCEKCYRWR